MLTVFVLETKISRPDGDFFPFRMSKLKYHGRLLFEDQDLGSGFEAEIKYVKGVYVGGSVIDLDDDFDLTAPLA